MEIREVYITTHSLRRLLDHLYYEKLVRLVVNERISRLPSKYEVIRSVINTLFDSDRKFVSFLKGEHNEYNELLLPFLLPIETDKGTFLSVL